MSKSSRKERRQSLAVRRTGAAGSKTEPVGGSVLAAIPPNERAGHRHQRKAEAKNTGEDSGGQSANIPGVNFAVP